MKKRSLVLVLISCALIIFLWTSTLLPAFKGEETKMESVNDAFTYTERYAAQVDRVRVRFEHRDYSRYRLTTNGLVREGELRTEQGYKADETATVYVLNSERPAGEQIRYVKLTQKPEYLYLVDSAGDLVLGTPLTIEN